MIQNLKDWLRGRHVHGEHRAATAPRSLLPGPPIQRTPTERDDERDGGVTNLRGGVRVSVRCKNILIIVTNGCIIRGVETVLANAGYEVQIVQGLAQALKIVQAEMPALLIVCGGPDPAVYRALRGVTSVPMLALLAQETEVDMLAALEAGADDCQPAAIGSQEALLRVRSLLRRCTA